MEIHVLQSMLRGISKIRNEILYNIHTTVKDE